MPNGCLGYPVLIPVISDLTGLLMDATAAMLQPCVSSWLLCHGCDSAAVFFFLAVVPRLACQPCSPSSSDSLRPFGAMNIYRLVPGAEALVITHIFSFSNADVPYGT
jgi:hypothetical protein